MARCEAERDPETAARSQQKWHRPKQAENAARWFQGVLTEGFAELEASDLQMIATDNRPPPEVIDEISGRFDSSRTFR